MNAFKIQDAYIIHTSQSCNIIIKIRSNISHRLKSNEKAIDSI